MHALLQIGFVDTELYYEAWGKEDDIALKNCNEFLMDSYTRNKIFIFTSLSENL